MYQALGQSLAQKGKQRGRERGKLNTFKTVNTSPETLALSKAGG